jgi:3-phenylpropionate/trans-cinnamate dioxygenase ferredoxin reductase subunit
VADRRSFVIVGAGLAGAKAAEALREHGFDGRITLIGSEPEEPYERPPLSKAYLIGDAAREETRVHPEGFYGRRDIELLTATTATGLDPVAHRVALADGATLDYDRLLIATGAVPRRPPIPGAGLEGVHVLRTLADADGLRTELAPGARLVVVGAGWIGCEVAAAARRLGADVTLVEQAGAPLQGVLGPALGAFFADVHRAHGVDLLTGAGVEAIEGRARVEQVRLAGGRTVPCDAVLLGVGVAPDTAFAATGRLEIENGIVADEELRTSAPDVFAAGDVVSAHHPRYGRRVRVEHWANALHQGESAARSMLGQAEPYDRLPYFFSDQYEHGLEYVGLHGPDDRLAVAGRPGDGPFRAFWVGADDRVTAGLHVDDWEAIDDLRRLVGSRAPASALAR